MINRVLLRRNALILVWIGFLWNFLEAGVALWSGFVANSVALLAFGLDSLVEIFAGAVLLSAFISGYIFAGKIWEARRQSIAKKRFCGQSL